MIGRVLNLFDRVGILRAGDHHMREVVSGAAIAFIWRAIGAACQFASVVIIARSFGTDGLGIYVIAFMVCTIASTIGRIGLDQTLLRIMAVHAERGELAAMKGVYRQGLVVTTAVSLALTAVLFVAASWLSEAVFKHHDLAVVMRWMILSIVPFSVLNITATALLSVKKIQYSSLVQVGAIPLLNCLTLVILIYYDIGLQGAAWAYVASTAAVWYIGGRLLNAAVPDFGRMEAQSPMTSGELIMAAMPNAWTSIMIVLLVLADSLILGYFRPPDEVGMYNAALRITGLAAFLLTAFIMVVSPKFAAMYEAGDIANIERIAKHSTRLMFAILVPPLLLCILAPEFVMAIFGKGFQDAGLSLAILAVGQLVFTALSMAGQLLLMTRREKSLRNIMFVSLAMNVALSVVLAPMYGAPGVAVAHVVAYALTGLAAQYAVKREIGITTHLF